MDVVELGGIRLHILRVHPGLPHEADRVTRELNRLAPALLLADVDTDDSLRLRGAVTDKKPYEPSFFDALFAEETRRRFAPDDARVEHPLAAAARWARDRRSEFVPLRPTATRPGLFARRRARKTVEALDVPNHAAFPHAYGKALADAKLWEARADVESAQKRLMNGLVQGRAPVAAIVQAHRADDYLAFVRATGRIPA